MMSPIRLQVLKHGQVVGTLQLPTFLVKSPSDYACDPPHCLTLAQVVEICTQINKLPQVHQGRFGDYQWTEIR